MGQRERQPHTTRIPRQVAVLAVRRCHHGLEVCLIRRKDSAKWGIPKGFIDRGDTPEQAALNEALEEAGVKGQVLGDSIGTYDYKKWSALLTVSVYLMEVVEEQEHWREMRFRERGWRSLQEAAVLLEGHPIRALWDRVTERLTTFGQRDQ
jgi:8-oxo-dGTP pyrophosphatase MutT (NUDIX family)